MVVVEKSRKAERAHVKLFKRKCAAEAQKKKKVLARRRETRLAASRQLAVGA